jgi:hypothetical protein
MKDDQSAVISSSFVCKIIATISGGFKRTHESPCICQNHTFFNFSYHTFNVVFDLDIQGRTSGFTDKR